LGERAAGRKVLLGLRPEHLKPSPESEAEIRLEVMAVETLGADTLAHGRIAGGNGVAGELVARLSGGMHVAAGEVLPLSIEADMAHLFDPATGKRI
ncbi:MAG: TOBE domain-containing protein, partial [Mesorhizobium sp.]|nr:TOBE domain-containing protein [Mesorhizobium sp.]